MKKYGFHAIAATALLLLSGGTFTTSCSPKDSLPVIPDTVALFDYFRYTGQDDFYQENPLTEENAFYTTILPGWYSDPSVCTNGQGDYFLVTSTFSYYPGVPLFHSRDLVNWQQVGHVLNRPSQLQKLVGQHVSGGIYAPAISYNPKNQTYYMVTTNVGVGNFFVKTKDPFGDWSDPILLPGVGGIDPSFFFDEDGRAYIVNNEDAPNNQPEYNGHRTIRIQEFDVEHDSLVGPRVILINKGVHPEEHPFWIEGPHMYKINGRYFLMAAEGGTGEHHSEVIFSGTSPMGKFTPWKNNPILTQRQLNPKRRNPITCAGHADLIQTKEGDWWAVFLACRPINGQFENLGRETFLLPLHWSKDGFPYITQEEDVIPMIAYRDGVKRDSVVTFGNFTREVDFSEETLPLEWMTLRAPATERYSLTEQPGYLSLKCAPVKASEKEVPAFVCRRMQHHRFVAETRLVFNAQAADCRAGVMLFKDETHHYFLGEGRNEQGKCLNLWKVDENGEHLMATQSLEEQTKTVELRVVSEGTHYNFFYAVKSGEWHPIAEQVDAEFLSTAYADGFTGSVIALYATKDCKR